ncbi:Tetratricopeptide repeat protein 7A [Quillaja saponaria]|uniref:Tetratricopeptide repeat protein 7A n=1 Tax=Quillaja saponaria TaxID=32244 RepID=A0AAD7PKM8_QUISA|nr:Tetratricopeptide repeat protein 7A [Quillaja saponaria]
MIQTCFLSVYRATTVTGVPCNKGFLCQWVFVKAGDWESKFKDTQVDEAESTLKEALSLNYEEARALLGRLEYQRENFDAALQVFQGIDITGLTPRMITAILERTRQRKSRPKGNNMLPDVMTMHSVSLLLEAILLKAKSLEELWRYIDPAKKCKLQEISHKALELLPNLWTKAGFLDEAITAYRHALGKPWNLEPQLLADMQKDLAAMLLYGGVEASLLPQMQLRGPTMPRTDQVEQILPGIYNRAERWYFLALCYSAAGLTGAALNILMKVSGSSEAKHKPHFPSFLLGAKLCSEDPIYAHEGIKFSRKVIDIAKHQNDHFLGVGHKFLGVCYGVAARFSVLDSERVVLQKKSLNSLNHAVAKRIDDPEVMFSLGLENAMQRNLDATFDNAMMYADMMAGSSGRGWQLLDLIVSAQQQFKDAETIEQPKQSTETYRIFLALIEAQKEIQLEAKNFDLAKIFRQEASIENNLEMAAWQDLATVYAKLGSLPDAETCVTKAKSIEFFSPRSWHTTGKWFEARSLSKEALVSFSISLSIEPGYVPSTVSTAELLLKLGKQSFPIARSFLMNFLLLEPTNHDAWFNLGLLSKMEGSLPQAAEFFQAAHELKLSAPVQSYI